MTGTNLPGLEWVETLVGDSNTTTLPESRVTVVNKFLQLLTPPKEKNTCEVSVVGSSTVSTMHPIILNSPELIRAFSTELENCIWELATQGGGGMQYKHRVYALTFNLNSKQNTDLKSKILCGYFTPLSLATADADHITSDSVKLQRDEQREKYFATHVMKKESDNAEIGGVIEGEAEPANEPLPDTVEEPQTGAEQHVAKRIRRDSDSVKASAESTVTDNTSHDASLLLQYCDLIKQRLGKLTYPDMQKAAVSFIEYIERHIHK